MPKRFGPTSQDPKSRKTTYTEHQKLVHAILVELSQAKYGMRVWKNFTGAAKSLTGDRVIRIGNPGAADILGIRAPEGSLVAIEVKSGEATQSAAQKLWQKMIESHGGIYIVARSIDDIKALSEHANTQEEKCPSRSCMTWPKGLTPGFFPLDTGKCPGTR